LVTKQLRRGRVLGRVAEQRSEQRFWCCAAALGCLGLELLGQLLVMRALCLEYAIALVGEVLIERGPRDAGDSDRLGDSCVAVAVAGAHLGHRSDEPIALGCL